MLRYNIGNPPGKDKKYGDAINWETLLESVPNGEDLFFISADKDYASLYDERLFHPFLSREWENKKQSKIIFFKSLVDFLKKHVKDIELQAENEKDSLIEELTHSGSFRTTHRIINELSKHYDWSIRQIQDMCAAAVENRQISWIIDDTDVYEFYKKLLENKSAQNSPDESISIIRDEIQRITSELTGEAEDEYPPWIF